MPSDPTTPVERALSKGLQGAGGIVAIVTPVFLSYVCIAAIGRRTGALDVSYPLLSLQHDPVFDVLVAVLATGLFAFSGALFVLTAIPPWTTSSRDVVLVLSGAATGSSAATGYHTVPQALRVLVSTPS